MGVNVDIFKPTNKFITDQIRKEFKIPNNHFVIGSFQKDGEGKKLGLDPKLIKGPDILFDVIDKLSEELPITVLLSAPARGYIIEKLKSKGIKFIHKNVLHPNQLSKLYSAIDLYLITSREEGGPKGLIEALSSGKKVVTTPVGMSKDLDALKIKNLKVSNTYESSELVNLCLEQLPKTTNIIDSNNSHNIISSYCSWQKVAEMHTNFLYNNL